MFIFLFLLTVFIVNIPGLIIHLWSWYSCKFIFSLLYSLLNDLLFTNSVGWVFSKIGHSLLKLVHQPSHILHMLHVGTSVCHFSPCLNSVLWKQCCCKQCHVRLKMRLRYKIFIRNWSFLWNTFLLKVRA